MAWGRSPKFDVGRDVRDSQDCVSVYYQLNCGRQPACHPKGVCQMRRAALAEAGGTINSIRTDTRTLGWYCWVTAMPTHSQPFYLKLNYTDVRCWILEHGSASHTKGSSSVQDNWGASSCQTLVRRGESCAQCRDIPSRVRVETLTLALKHSPDRMQPLLSTEAFTARPPPHQPPG